MKRDEATTRQIQASSPSASTWLSANAGSGKTRVLTDRVARLLLEGVSPQNILCLTYTKAAAGEMQNRLFNRLGEWAMKDDKDLSGALEELGVEGGRDLSLARQLFARAIETPGGLKIQTIHAYCAALLRRFPMEAGVSPQFSEMDERAAKRLRADVLDQISAGQKNHKVQELAKWLTGEDLNRLTEEIVKHRVLFQTPPAKNNVWQWFGLKPDADEASIIDACFHPGDLKLLEQFLVNLRTGIATDQKHAAILEGADFNLPGYDLLRRLERFVLKQSEPFSAKIGTVPAKALREGICQPMMPELDALFGRVEDARRSRIALLNAKRTMALHQFAHSFCEEYENAKLVRGWLDFDDLILKAGALLTDPEVAAWVLYRLDGGLDHILVDEAQDTSPAQWTIIDSLAREFTTGSGARDNEDRTLFVVGDPKQSIYSFQGAEPEAFDRMRKTFSSRLEEVGRKLEVLPLEHSFRSSSAILGFVDTALEAHNGLGGTFKHRAFFENKPGRVDLWPPIEPVKFDEDRDWNDPVDRPSPRDHRVQLADHIADQIKVMLKTETIPAENGEARPVQAGDIIVLVRSRKELFHEIIRACKVRDIPIAGADQLRIGAELAVKDLTALLSFLATPEDNLSLATVLRSPLFGWSEDELFRLAHYRDKKTFLWRALSQQSENHPETLATLMDLRDSADFLRPYELLERVLTRHGGRKKLLARLGTEAEDGIDALLAQAMAYESLETPSLTGFLIWLQSDEVTIKRQMDTVSQQVRVMTVHGSKGLEAPIVILPDLAATRASDMPNVAQLPDGHAFWSPVKKERTESISAVAESLKDAQTEERMRLLYVAMTRAEQWLILAAAGDVGKAETGWYRVCEAAMDKVGGVELDSPTGVGRRHQTGLWAAPTVNPDIAPDAPALALPDWLSAPAPTPAPAVKPLSPSDLGGAKALPGEANYADEHGAMKLGRQIHLLLEHLPAYPSTEQKVIARVLLSQGPDRATDAEADEIISEAIDVLNTPALSDCFAPTALAEVEVVADLSDFPNRKMQGIIDRLIVTPEEVLIIDYKTNRIVPKNPSETPEGLLRQLGAYRAILHKIYPDRPIRTAILWTKTRELMRIEDALVDEALARLDASGLPT